MDLKYFADDDRPRELRYKSKLIGVEILYHRKRYIVVNDKYLDDDNEHRRIGIVKSNTWTPFRMVVYLYDEDINFLELIR